MEHGAADEHRRRGGRDRDQGGPQVGLRGQGRARRARPRSSSPAATSTAAPRPSSASPPTRTRATTSARTPRASGSCPYGDLTRCAAAIDDTTVAVLLEPIQGEAGVIVPPAGLPAPACARSAPTRGVLFIADEIQSGLGRTGRTFACDHEGVVPDMYMLGKALGGGIVPVSAVVGRRDVLGVLRPGEHGSTFGGNPLACAVGAGGHRAAGHRRVPGAPAELGAHLHDRLGALVGPRRARGARPRPVGRRRHRPALCGPAGLRAAGRARRPGQGHPRHRRSGSPRRW